MKGDHQREILERSSAIVLIGELSKRAAGRKYGVRGQTLEKMLAHSEPPGYQKTAKRKSKLYPFVPVIEGMLSSERKVQ